MPVTIEEINGPDPLLEALETCGPDVKTLIKDLEASRQMVHTRLLKTKTKKLSHTELATLARTLESLTTTFIGFYGLQQTDVDLGGNINVTIQKFGRDEIPKEGHKHKDPA